MKTLLAVAAFALTVPTPVLAWGQTGHRVIGKLAEERLDAKTRAEIEKIIGTESLAEAATFADEERSNPAPFWQTEASPWHYVTVPAGKSYSEVGAPTEGDAYTALQRFTATLRDRGASQEDKAIALRFIVHIVGDLHQPLHAGDGTDRGGNDVKVDYFGQSTNLHSVWDSALLDSEHLSFTEFAARLDRRITPDLTIEWWNADPMVWIAESAVIRPAIYPSAEANKRTQLSYAYQYQHLPIAEERLEQAGVRLAAYLGSIWK